MDEDEFLTLEATAEAIESYRAVEEMLFTILGSWVETEEHPKVKVFLAGASRRHGHNAARWAHLAPRVAGLVREPSLPAASADSLRDLDTARARLSGYRQAMAEITDRYRVHRSRSSLVSDAAFAAELEVLVAYGERSMNRASSLLDGVPDLAV